MPLFSQIAIIYNPNSTGSGKDLATNLKQQLARLLPNQPVTLHTTDYAGHGFELARSIALAHSRALIISASGDGGYHEVVNGIMEARAQGAMAVAGLLPAGNANDHFNALHSEDIVKQIEAGKIKTIDLLELTSLQHGQPFSRYAHSYIGIGLTPKVGHQLNKTTLNRLNEIWIVLRVLFALRSVRIKEGSQRKSYDSLIFSNISRMSKVLSLADDSSVTDGKFEVTPFKRRNRLALIRQLIKASTVGLSGKTSVSEYLFKTIKSCAVQIDGEIYTLDANSGVKVAIRPAALECLI